jgi:hypothetical protein
MSDRNRPGGLRLLTGADLEGPVVGWLRGSEGEGSLVNKRGFAMLRVVVQKLIDGKMKDLYDQPVIVENAGSIAVCRVGGRVGLVRNFRFIGRRIVDAGVEYIRRLDEEGRWGELAESLGLWQWELPRGLTHLTEETDLERFIIETAKAEALEESGFVIENPQILGMVNTNPTFFPHSQYVVSADIVSKGENQPEDLEILGRTELFSPRELRRMAGMGELQDGLTLSALALAGIHF